MVSAEAWFLYVFIQPAARETYGYESQNNLAPKRYSLLI